jgi:hypothetical protein
MPYFGYALLNPSICVAIKRDVLELCLIATQMEGFKSA